MAQPNHFLLLVVLLSSGCVDDFAVTHSGAPRYGFYPPTPYHDQDQRNSLDDPPETGHQPAGRIIDSPKENAAGLLTSGNQVEPVPPTNLPEAELEREAPAPAKVEQKGEVPTATKSTIVGRVKSPFQPDREIDVSGLPSGSLAKDPFTGKLFRIP